MTKYGRAEYHGRACWGMIEDDKFKELDAAPWEGSGKTGTVLALNECRLLAPVTPSKVILVGLNYGDHIKESQSASSIPDEPVIFLKPPTAVIGPLDDIPYPPDVDRVDYEGELAAVIGKETYRVDENGARSAIFGYTCLNDITARDLQRKDVQWTRAKGFDGFAPVGPWIATDVDPLDLKLETFLNGELRQSSRTSFQIWDVYKLISFISRVMKLLPGDIVSTGTPKGVGPMQPGDTVRVSIENIGVLENRVVLG